MSQLNNLNFSKALSAIDFKLIFMPAETIWIVDELSRSFSLKNKSLTTEEKFRYKASYLYILIY